MKKILLSLGMIAAAMTANATVYTIFDASASDNKAWAEKGDGFTTTVTVDGKSFTMTTSKGGSTTPLLEPTSQKQWRVYKGSELNITSNEVSLKGIRFTIDGAKYVVDGTASEGWKYTLDKDALTITFDNSNGSSTFNYTASSAQVRIMKVEVSDEAFEAGETPDVPDVPVTPATVVKSVKETVALESGTKVTVDYPTVVAFVNRSNCFVQDKAGDFIQIYNSNSYQVNDIIPAGWTATYELYNGATPELKDATLPESTEKGEFKPAVVAPADITTDMVNNVIAVKDVVFEEATPAEQANFSGTCNGVEISLRNNYKLASVEPGKYNLTLLVTIYRNEVSLYVINYEADVNTAVEAVEVENGEAQYYTLTGVKVANPENGIFIRVRNGKADKVVL
ncbi:MAG: hypothetical protein K2I91_02150 [Muribaculaceae bacterium]|nr:hypothetical protein [Muribaculaceae bacterium]